MWWISVRISAMFIWMRSSSVIGRANGERPWNPAALSLAEITVGARFYTNGPGKQEVRGFSRCDIAEVLLFNRTLLAEWAYVQTWSSDGQRTRGLARWLHIYNDHRHHTAIGGPPMSP